MRKINQKILISLLSFFIFFMSSAVASEQKINTTGIYIAGASESLNDAKKHALEDAMRQATEQAGVLVNSYSKTHNMTLSDDEVTIVATKIVKITKKNFVVNLISDSEIKVIAHIETIIDTDSINDDILALKKENQKLHEEKDAIKKKQHVLERLHVLSENIRNKYKGKFNLYEKPKARIKLYPDSHYSLALENFYTDMKAGEYKEARTDISIASLHYKKQQNINKSIRYYYLDKTVCDFQLKRIETYIAMNDYFMAMIECIYFGDAIRENNYYNLIDKDIYQNLYDYTSLLKDYFDMYESDKWERIIKARGGPRIG